ncbi:MAG: hypothetical protein ACR2H4_20070, partial [Pyrinomonadaceae bacterium]
MAENLELLFKLRGDSAGAKTAISETRAAVAQLRSQFGGELGQMQRVSTVALGQVTQSLAQV